MYEIKWIKYHWPLIEFYLNMIKVPNLILGYVNIFRNWISMTEVNFKNRRDLPWLKNLQNRGNEVNRWIDTLSIHSNPHKSLCWVEGIRVKCIIYFFVYVCLISKFKVEISYNCIPQMWYTTLHLLYSILHMWYTIPRLWYINTEKYTSFLV